MDKPPPRSERERTRMATIASGVTSQTEPKPPTGGGEAQTMRALFKHHAGEGLQFDPRRPRPTPGPRDVLIKVQKVGICGTDRHIWEGDPWAASRIPVGIVTGHQLVGTVEAVGSAVTKYKPGRRGSAEGHITSWSDYN